MKKCLPSKLMHLDNLCVRLTFSLLNKLCGRSEGCLYQFIALLVYSLFFIFVSFFSYFVATNCNSVPIHECTTGYFVLDKSHLRKDYLVPVLTSLYCICLTKLFAVKC